MVLSGYERRRAGRRRRGRRADARGALPPRPGGRAGDLFLSGGQTDEDCDRAPGRDERRGPHPWQLSFSFGRALQAPPSMPGRGAAGERRVGAGRLLPPRQDERCCQERRVLVDTRDRDRDGAVSASTPGPPLRHRGGEAAPDRRAAAATRSCTSLPGSSSASTCSSRPEPDRQQPHADDEVYVVLEGSGALDVEGEAVELREGHAVFVPARVEHRFSAYEQLRRS